MLNNSATQEIYGLKYQLAMDSIKHFGYTYEKPGAHHQEPPPSCTVQLYIQAKIEVDSVFLCISYLL